MMALRERPQRCRSARRQATIRIVFGSTCKILSKKESSPAGSPWRERDRECVIGITLAAYLPQETVSEVSRVASDLLSAYSTGALWRSAEGNQDHARALGVIVRPIALRDPDEMNASVRGASGGHVRNSVYDLWRRGGSAHWAQRRLRPSAPSRLQPLRLSHELWREPAPRL